MKIRIHFNTTLNVLGCRAMERRTTSLIENRFQVKSMATSRTKAAKKTHRKGRASFVLRLCALLAAAQLVILPLQAKDIPGATQTSYAVSPSGAFQFRVPIITPQGVNGVQPNLALSFSSSRGNGRVGIGWDLTGLSVINRCGQTLGTHGRNQGVTYTKEDRFCLDGKPLIKVSSGSNYYNGGGTEYRTEIEEFSKIVAYGSQQNLDGTSYPTSFKVYRKDGTVLEYGGGDANVGKASLVLAASNVIHCWKVRRVGDRNNNAYEVSYESEKAFPDEINYAGNKIKFAYAARPDVRYRYYASERVDYIKRLTKVTTSRNNSIVREYRLNYASTTATSPSRLTSIVECGKGGSPCMPEIKVAWESDGSGFANNNTFKPKTALFDYENYHGTQSLRTRGQFSDVNADGWPDQVIAYRTSAQTFVRKTYLGGPNGFTDAGNAWRMPIEFNSYDRGVVDHSQITGNEIAKATLIDVNGDNLPDVVYGFIRPGTPSGTLVSDRGVYLNNGENGWESSLSSFVPPKHFNSYVDTARCGGTNCWPFIYSRSSRGQFVDLNGDGLVDFLAAYSERPTLNTRPLVDRRQVFINNGSNWVYDSNFTFPDIVEEHHLHGRVRHGALVDVNGDGLPDWVRSYKSQEDNNTFRRGIWLNTGSKFKAASNGVHTTAFPEVLHFGHGNRNRYQTTRGSFVDLNGDGKADFIVDADDGTRKAYLNTGTKFIHNSNYDAQGHFTRVDHEQIGTSHLTLIRGSYIDVNRDGLVDYLESYISRQGSHIENVWLNNGNGWQQDTSGQYDRQ